MWWHQTDDGKCGLSKSLTIIFVLPCTHVILNLCGVHAERLESENLNQIIASTDFNRIIAKNELSINLGYVGGSEQIFGSRHDYRWNGPSS